VQQTGLFINVLSRCPVSLYCSDCQAAMWPCVRRSRLHYALWTISLSCWRRPRHPPPLLLAPFSAELEEGLQSWQESEQWGVCSLCHRH